MCCRVEIPDVFDREVALPQSKSIMARALIVNALAEGAMCNSQTGNFGCDKCQPCDDITILLKALTSCDSTIDVKESGTAMRFLTAYFACLEGRAVALDGADRMHERPIGPLVDALRQMGARIDYLGNEGFPPLKISGRKLHGGNITMRSDVSSQFVSALLMIAPVAGGMTLALEGDIVSRPYIDMTIALMHHHGVDGLWDGNNIVVPAGNYESKPGILEGDWTAASYWFALKALIPQSRIVLTPLYKNSLQGDIAIVPMMEPLGVNAQFEKSDRVVLFSNKEQLVPTFYERDMAATPDLVPTLAVTLCLLRVPFTLTGVRNLRIKESDRLGALHGELAKLGYSLGVGDNSLCYNGNYVERKGEIVIDPHGDHRIAMAMSLAATRHNIIMKNAEVVAKSYPNFFSEILKTDN